MNNRLLLSLNILLIIGLTGVYYLHFTNQEKIAYVDSTKLLTNYKGMAQAQQAYQQKASVWQANIDSLTQETQVALQKHQQAVAHMSTSEKEKSEALVRTKQQQLINYQQAIQEKATQEDQQMTQTVVAEVNKYLREYGDEQNYKVILVANETGTIAYAQEGMDVTSEVLERLNSKFVK